MDNDYARRVGSTIEEEYTRLDSLISSEDKSRKLKACSYVKHRDCYKGSEVKKINLHSGYVKDCFEKVSKGLVEYLTPKSGGWFRILPPIARSLIAGQLVENREEMVELEKMTSFVDAVLIDSNFHCEFLKSVKDYFASGTGHLSMKKGKRPLQIVFRNEDPQKVVFDTDEDGLVISYIRQYSLSVRECVRIFGLDTVVGSEQRSAKNMDEMLTLFEIVCPATEYLYDAKEGRFFDFSDRIGKYAHFVWCQEKARMFADDSFKELPMFTFRRDVDSAECLTGHGVVEDNLEDIIIFDDMMNLRQIGFQKNANPPMVAPMALFGKMDVRPYSINYVPDMSQRPMPIVDGKNYAQMLQDIQDMKESLRKSLGVDVFLPIINSNDSRKTAYEVSEIKNDSMVLMSQSIGDINRELLTPLVKSIIKTFYEEFTEQKNKVLEKYIDSLRIELNSIFVQRINAYFKLNALEKSLNMMIQVGGVQPEVFKYADMQKILQTWFVGQGLPTSLLSDPKKLAMAEAQAQQLAMAQAQAQINKDNASALGSMQKGVELA